MFEEGYILDLAIRFGFLSITAAMAIAFIRLVIGKSLADRVVALDLITVLAVAFCGLFAISADHAAFIDVAIALALVAFLATVAFARFAERWESERPARKSRKSGT